MRIRDHRRGNFWWAHNAIFDHYLRRKLISAREAIVYGALCRFSYNEPVTVSLRKIAEYTNCSERLVRQAIDQLEAVGLIAIERRSDPTIGTMANIYYLLEVPNPGANPAPGEVSAGAGAEFAPGGSLTPVQNLHRAGAEFAGHVKTFDQNREDRDLSIGRPRSLHNDEGERAAPWLIPFVRDFARELGDEAPFPASLARVSNLWRASGVNQDDFTDLLYEARRRTQARSHTIIRPRAATGLGPLKNKFPYFCQVLEGLLAERREA